MQHRKLGRTGLDVGVIGMGTEYLNRRPRKTVASVIREAIDKGVNYVDVVFAFPEYRDNLGAALAGQRDRVILAGHIGPAETDGHYRLSRDVRECEAVFVDLLRRLHTDYVDVVFIQMVNTLEGYREVMKPRGVMDLARRLQHEGKARFIGISGHKPRAAVEAIRSNQIDVFMFPINIAWDFAPGRQEVLQACVEQGVGLVAMKPFGGGRLFQQKDRPVGPVQCLEYVLSQRGVCSVVPGVKNLRELRAALALTDATDEQKDFHPVLASLQEDTQGNCLYCNHCLPCPVGIDVARVIHRVDMALLAVDDLRGRRALQQRVNYYYPGRIRYQPDDLGRHSAPASDCVECGVCMERCPFDVDVVVKMRQAVEIGVGG